MFQNLAAFMFAAIILRRTIWHCNLSAYLKNYYFLQNDNKNNSYKFRKELRAAVATLL
jgi:hypothetical protein